MACSPGRAPSQIHVAIACLALAGCTRYGFRSPVEIDDTGPGSDGAWSDGSHLDTSAPLQDATRPGDSTTSVPVDAAGLDTAQIPDATPGPDLVPPPPPSGLVGFWSFDEGTGQVVAGAPGNDGYRGKNNIVDAADPSWDKTAARICKGAALTFDGNDDVVTIPGASPAGLSKLTITFSLYVTGNGGGGLPRILTKENGGSYDILVHYRSMDKAIAVNMFNTANTLFATFAAGVVHGQRANWALTYDDGGDRKLHVYKNGKETTYTRQDILGGTMRTTTNPWRIGNEVTGVRGFDGTIDEVRVYDRVLTSAEIVALSNLCSP